MVTVMASSFRKPRQRKGVAVPAVRPDDIASKIFDPRGHDGLSAPEARSAQANLRSNTTTDQPSSAPFEAPLSPLPPLPFGFFFFFFFLPVASSSESESSSPLP